MKEHPDIVKFCHFPAYVRTHSTGILRGLPLSTRTLEQSLVCYTLSEVYRLSPVRTYAAIAPSEPYRGATKFEQGELDPAKQKAGYHRHSDTLPLLVYRSAYSCTATPLVSRTGSPISTLKPTTTLQRTRKKRSWNWHRRIPITGP